MSRDVLERILWSLSVDRFSKEKYREDPQKFLSRFPIDEEGVRMILEFDVKEMQEVGVNPMLTLGYWIEMSPDRRVSSYNRKLGSDSAHSASIKG
jgi:protocatechuate 4,5-dioxygenase alpha chain